MIDLKKAEKLAMHVAKDAGNIVLKNTEKIVIVKEKDKHDFCTNIDIKSEKLIIKEIRRAYPKHNIISEELGTIDKKSDYTWIIDPIDGTKNFMRNIPIFSVSVALQYKKDVIVGAVYDPISRMLFHARKGGGAWLGKSRINVSKTRKLEHAFVYVDIPNIYHLNKKDAKTALNRLDDLVTSSLRVRSLGSGSLGMCDLAQGSYDIYFDLTSHTKFVDIAAASIIAKEAGGTVTNLEGKPITRHDEHFLATNSHLEKQILKLLGKH